MLYGSKTTPQRTGTIMKLFAVLCLVTLAVLPAQAQQMVITKERTESNPGIYLADFQGPAPMKEALLRALTQSDWFTPVNQPSSAKYTLKATAVAGTMDLQLSGGGLNVSLRESSRSSVPSWVVYQAVDALITKVFQAPGLCATTIAFANGARGRKEVFVCNFDGTGARQLTHNGSISTEPSWGSQAGSLVYTLYDNGYTDVVLADLVNQRQRRISQEPGLNAGAALSHDGQWAALCLSRDRKVELYTLRLIDKAKRRITNDVSVESSPCWAPNDSQICFVSDKAGKPNLFLVPAAGGTPQRLISSTAEAVSPDWSAISNKICFATRLGGEYQLAVVDMNKPRRDAVLVTRGGGNWESPSWAPDGRHVVCTRSGGKSRELCIVDTWFGRVLKVTTAGDYSLPSWSDLHD